MADYGHEMRANPLRSFPRNQSCGCGSGLKFKKCCLPKLNPVVPMKLAEMVIRNWAALLSGTCRWAPKKETANGT